MTRMTPSAPIPRRRSQRAATKAPSELAVDGAVMVRKQHEVVLRAVPLEPWKRHGLQSTDAATITAPAAQDRLDGAVDVGLRGGVVGHRDAHVPATAPRRAAHPAGAVALDAFDDGIRRRVVAEADEHLVEHDVVGDLGPRLAELVGEATGERAGALDELGQAASSELTDRGPDREAARPPGRVEDEIRAAGFPAPDQVGGASSTSQRRGRPGARRRPARSRRGR